MKHSRQGVINWFVRQAIDGEEIKLYGDGKQVRDCNYVDDVVEALLLAGLSPKADGEIFNLGGSHLSLKEIVELIARISGSKKYGFIPFPEGSKKIEIGDYIADYSKIKKTLGWEPKVDMEEGLKKTVEYYNENKKRYW
jgi:nucleoside-diphosphate-sugar epimerase